VAECGVGSVAVSDLALIRPADADRWTSGLRLELRTGAVAYLWTRYATEIEAELVALGVWRSAVLYEKRFIPEPEDYRATGF